MKLSIMSTQPSSLRRLSEQMPLVRGYGPSLSRHILASAVELGVLDEGSLANAVARAREGMRPLANVDDLLWITAPDISYGNDRMRDLAKRAAHLPGKVTDGSAESEEWWKEAFSLFSTTPADQERVRKQIELETRVVENDPEPASAPDAPAGDGDLNQQLLGVIKRHKETGDKIDRLIDDIAAYLQRGDTKSATRAAKTAIKKDKEEGASPPPPASKKDDKPIDKHTPMPRPKDWFGSVSHTEGADRLLCAVLAEDGMGSRGEEVLAQALARSQSGDLWATGAGMELYEDWRGMLRNAANSKLGMKARAGVGNLYGKGVRGLKDAAGRMMDRMQDPEGSAARDDVDRSRIDNVLLAKSALNHLARVTRDRLMRMPMGAGEALLAADRTPENRQAARQALGISGNPAPSFGTYTATASM